jgi:hypothetical protein
MIEPNIILLAFFFLGSLIASVCVWALAAGGSKRQ